jgi:GNAT superfamily N-acetyltransferase
MIEFSLLPKTGKKVIRKAETRDLDAIMDIVWRTVMLLQSEGNMQWGDDYPTIDDFSQDIDDGTLYVCETDDEILGFLCCNQIPPQEYGTVAWSLPTDPALIIHRFAVSPETHRKGIGTALMKQAEEVARAQGCRSLRTDTCSLNIRMRLLFVKMGYEKVGEVHFANRTQTFYCFEKMIPELK